VTLRTIDIAAVSIIDTSSNANAATDRILARVNADTTEAMKSSMAGRVGGGCPHRLMGRLLLRPPDTTAISLGLRPPPPPPKPAAAVQVVPQTTTTAFDGSCINSVASAKTPTYPNLPPFAFQGYVTPQGVLAMNSSTGHTFQGQIDQMHVLRAHVAGPACG
jgi:hypothetical protein